MVIMKREMVKMVNFTLCIFYHTHKKYKANFFLKSEELMLQWRITGLNVNIMT